MKPTPPTAARASALGETVSMIINAPSVTVKAKEDFPDLYKRMWHARYLAGAAATGARELNLTHGIMFYSKNRYAAEASLLWLMQPKQYEAWMTARRGRRTSSSGRPSGPQTDPDPEACQGMPAKDVVAWTERELRQIVR